MSRNLFGMHDPGSWEELVREAGREAWCVHTEAIGCDPKDASGKNFGRPGITPVVRLNNGYGTTGTIPTPANYQNFAQRCANFVAASTGCKHWIIGNEIAMEWEWPDGQQITLGNYISCFDFVYRAIHSVQADAIVIPQAPAPWNNKLVYDGNPTGDWASQLTDMLQGVRQVDAIAIHAYTHGHDASLIQSNAKMGAPFENRHFHFRTYRDFMDAIPMSLRNLPVLITESNPDGWSDVNNGWIQDAYAEVASWNRDNPYRQISCLAFYRWPDEDQDKFHIGSKAGVVEDFKEALKIDRKLEVLDLSQATRLKALTTLNIRRTPGNANKDGTDIFSSLMESSIVHLTGSQPVKAGDFEWREIFTASGEKGWVAVKALTGVLFCQLLP